VSPIDTTRDCGATIGRVTFKIDGMVPPMSEIKFKKDKINIEIKNLE
jgi:hypothetical protein